MVASTEKYDYIFGFGSIINPATHAPWLTRSNHQNSDTTAQSSSSSSKDGDHAADSSGTLVGRSTVVLAKFGCRRGWNFRSNTGFTALGIQRVSENDASDINGVLFQITSGMLADFDRREIGYDRVQIPLNCLEWNGSKPDKSFKPNARTWIYIPRSEQCLEADEDHPILQSYVDTVMEGCLLWGGEKMAEAFVRTTAQWSPFFLNDTPSSRRPWLYRQQYTVIDKILQSNNTFTHFSERRHPEEFASAFLMKSMRGAWSIPRRNSAFTGRDKELQQIHERLTALRNDGSTLVKLVGMGGVGKTQLCTEYCYRYFPSYYGLAIWLQAQSAESIVAGYRQLMADTSGGDFEIVQEKDADEIVTEVKARLYRSTVPWLLVFDNLDDHSLLEKFVPNGGRAGHVLVTTRHSHGDDFAEQEDQTMTLGCFEPQESIDLLCRAAGEQNLCKDLPKHLEAAKQLAEHLGHLPLALGMAAAYMRKCDVDCSEYLLRYATTNSNDGQNLGREAVASSLSLSLDAIKTENPVAWEALRLLCWMGPDLITKKLLRSLLIAKNEFLEEEVDVQPKNTLSLLSPLALRGRGNLPLNCVAVCAISTCLYFQRRNAKSALLLSSLSLSLLTALNRKVSPKMSDKLTGPNIRRSNSFSAHVFEQTDSTWTTLKSFSLLVVKQGNGSLHRLLAQALKVNRTKSDIRYSVEVCLRAVLDSWSFHANEVDTWQCSSPLLEHVKVVISNCVEQQLWSIDSAVLSREAGVFSAMALNRFEEARKSLHQSLNILDGLEESTCSSMQTRGSRSATLHELGRVFRYEGNFDDAHDNLSKALDIRKNLASRNPDLRHDLASTLHEFGVLELRKHALDPAVAFLQQALDLRRMLERECPTPSIEADCASTLHQLATCQVNRKPPCLDQAESLLTETLNLNMQIGQRAATLKQLARVAIRKGKFEIAERRLRQALELYGELYGEKTVHINVAAVRFQQGSLAFQREQYEKSWDHFSECLRTRRIVYGYSQGNHLEVSSVLHELGHVAFAQKQFDIASEKFLAEKTILDQLYETNNQRQRILQALLTSLTWMRKCAKEKGDEEKMRFFSAERAALKRKERLRTGTTGKALEVKTYGGTKSLQQEALDCRLAARQYALSKAPDKEKNMELLKSSLLSLSNEIERSDFCSMQVAALDFQRKVSVAITRIETQSTRKVILDACDHLRDHLRHHGVEVQDVTKRKTRKK